MSSIEVLKITATSFHGKNAYLCFFVLQNEVAWSDLSHSGRGATKFNSNGFDSAFSAIFGRPRAIQNLRWTRWVPVINIKMLVKCLRFEQQRFVYVASDMSALGRNSWVAAWRTICFGGRVQQKLSCGYDLNGVNFYQILFGSLHSWR